MFRENALKAKIAAGQPTLGVWLQMSDPSIAEIASLRQTSEGTVKAQTNAIYRKAGVSGRPQLLSLFVEDLMGQAVPVAAA